MAGLRSVIEDLKAEFQFRITFNQMMEYTTDGNPTQYYGFNSRLRQGIITCDRFLQGRCHVDCLFRKMRDLNMLNVFAEVFIRNVRRGRRNIRRN